MEIFKFSKGVPRLINMIANRCLIAGFVAESDVIDKAMVKRAKESLFGEKYGKIKKLKGKNWKQILHLQDEYNEPDEDTQSQEVS